MKEMKFRRELYSKVALLKAAYNYTNTAYIHLDSDSEYYYVTLSPKRSNQSEINWDITEDEFANEMLAQSVRHEIYLETKNIRELLLARAMATSVIDEGIGEPELPEGREEFQENEILKDWFAQDEND